MRPSLKLIFVTLPLVALGVGIVAFVISNKEPPARVELAERTSAVRFIVATTQPVTPEITGFGLATPARTYEAIAQVAGTADYVNPALSKGTILPAGTVLWRLSPSDFNLAIAQANANIRSVEARLAELAVSEANQQAALVIENEALDLKAQDLERMQTLFDAGTVPQTSLTNARAAHLAQRQKVLNIESGLALLPTQRAVQNEQIAVYQANLATAELNLARTELVLPFAARVASVTVEQGQFVKATQTTAVLDGVDAAEVEAQVSVADLRALLASAQADTSASVADPSALTNVLRQLDLTASVRLRLGDDYVEWSGIVDRISDDIDQKTGTIGVIIRVDDAYSVANPGDRPPLTKGMFVEVAITAPAVSGIALPRSAVRGGRVLLADDENRLRFATVETGLNHGDLVLVSSGISDGVRVIVSTPSPALDGMLLTLTEDTALAAELANAGQGE